MFKIEGWRGNVLHRGQLGALQPRRYPNADGFISQKVLEMIVLEGVWALRVVAAQSHDSPLPSEEGKP